MTTTKRIETRLLRTDAAADYLAMSPRTLAQLRWQGGGPTFSTLGKRMVVYRKEDLDAWVDAGRRASTSAKRTDAGGEHHAS